MSVLNGFKGVGEQGAHLLLGLAVILPALVAHTVFVRHLLAGLDAQQDIVGLLVLRIGIVDVVGGHQVDAQIPA